MDYSFHVFLVIYLLLEKLLNEKGLGSLKCTLYYNRWKFYFFVLSYVCIVLHCKKMVGNSIPCEEQKKKLHECYVVLFIPTSGNYLFYGVTRSSACCSQGSLLCANTCLYSVLLHSPGNPRGEKKTPEMSVRNNRSQNVWKQTILCKLVSMIVSETAWLFLDKHKRYQGVFWTMFLHEQ